MLSFDRLDHLVLTVKNTAVTCDSHAKVLGMEVVTFGEGRKALNFGQQKINLHPSQQGFEPKARTPTPGSADLCLITGDAIENGVAHLQNCQVEIIARPVIRPGALGKINPVSFRDPDNNLLELANYLRLA